MDNVYIATRQKNNVLVSIMRNKLDGTYSFVNLTKGHIYTCKFNTIEDAVKDMQIKKENGEVISYFKVGE